MSESRFKESVMEEIEIRFPNAIVLNIDPTFIRGFPDKLILFEDLWACLEFKKEKNASKRTHQEYYVNLLDDWSFASFIYPENRERVMDDLELFFSSGGTQHPRRNRL